MTANLISEMSSLDDTLTINNTSDAISINFNNSSNYYKQQQQEPSTPTSSSFTAMLAAAEAAVSKSSLNTEKDYDYELNNRLNIINNIHNLTDDDEDEDNNDFIRQQFHFNESFELDEENVMFNNNGSKIPSSQHQMIKNCSFQKCCYNKSTQQQQKDNNLIQFYCLNIKCKDLKIYFHNNCYETILRENKKIQRIRISSALEFTTQTTDNNILCMNCHYDYLKMSSSNNQITSSSSSSSSSSSKSISPPLNHSSKQQQQVQKKQITQQYPSSPINIMRANNMRKRSIGGLNNPPLPMPMQPLHESETIPSPQYSSVPQIFNLNNQMRKIHQQQQQQQHNHKNHQFKLKQSAPVNMPQSNRYRTLSCGSTGSFSASSSFSSSFGTSPIVNNQQAFSANTSTGLWKKMLSNNPVPSSYTNTSGNYTGTSCSSSSVSSICTYRGFNNNNNNDDVAEESTDQQTSTICSIEDKIVASSGNMFHKRDDWSILSRIPINKQNTIHIRLEDEGPYGNDEIRCYVLSHFSSLGVRDIKCVLCDNDLKLYDRFPLIDGTLFLSPIVYETAKAINSGQSHNKREQFVYGVCLQCLGGENSIKCKWCNKIWNSESLQIGTLYKYDIFAAFPCCQKRLCCNKCAKPVIDINDQLPYFSSYSEEVECQHCKYKSHHFIKPLDMVFNL